MAKSIIIKGVQSPERLLDETALFLHRVTTHLPEPKQKMLERLHQSDEVLAGQKVLVVDDDVRNIFALTSLLERHNMHVVSADNGRKAIELLAQEADIDIVLMDIMMPEMDGYETMRTIRQQPAPPPVAHDRPDRQGHERRPRKMPGSRRLRLHRQTGQQRATAFAHARLAA